MVKESVYLHYLSALLDGDKKTCKKIVTDLIDEGVDLKDIYIDLLQKSMYRVGQLWERDRANVSVEHIATQITKEMIYLVSSKINPDNDSDHSAVVTCVDKEFHEIGPKIISDFFEMHGWDVFYLGANTPRGEILRMIKEQQPSVVGLSINFYMNLVRLMKVIEEINENFPDQKIIIGGQALQDDKSDILSEYKNVTYIPTLDALEEYLSSYQNNSGG
jgi:methanogenic corrinoid protein MtbC1